MWKRALFALLTIVVLGAAGFVAWAWEPSLPPTEPPDPSSFNLEIKQRGAELAAIGNCSTCHTSESGRPFAGGRALPTPFGTIYSTNITPDPETGIGRWSEAAFSRAMREGVDRAGRHLYPAFPYDHFTKLTDEDVKALYAFLMTREPVRAEVPANDLTFPLNFRLAAAGWKLLFFHEGRYKPDPTRDGAWNRGAYLTEAAAHCGACHTPRNRLGAEEQDRHLGGGSAEGWYAPALNAASTAPVPWDADSLQAYLHGRPTPLHGAAFGPMAPVVRNLAQVPDGDVLAIAGYIASAAGPPTAERKEKANDLVKRLTGLDLETVGLAGTAAPAGSAIFAGACATCHSETRPFGAAGAVNLALSSTVNAPDPRNALRVVLDGIRPAEGERGALMPGFSAALTDRQIAEVIGYVRSRFSTQPAWSGLDERVRRMREGKDQL